MCMGVAPVCLLAWSLRPPCCRQGIADVKVSFHPQVAEQGSLSHKPRNAPHISRPPRLSEASFVPVKNPQFLSPWSVHKEGRVGGDHQLAAGRCLPTFFGQLGQQAGVQVILWFLRFPCRPQPGSPNSCFRKLPCNLGW
jgi:hypothetical protein